ncbi:MAG: 3-hydroxyacyl-CoA dehydrogenase NAD-binding domain-containing protein [Rhizomicrobium sp.]
MTTVACIGAGVIGRNWAALCATKGHDVRVYDADRGAALSARERIVETLSATGSQSVALGAQERIRVVDTIGEAMLDAAVVLEAVAEDLSVKRSVLAMFETCGSPSGLFLSSTSTFRCGDIAEGSAASDRCLVAHPLNPPHLIPLVEIVPGAETSAETVQSARDFLQQLGQTVIALKRDVSGFATNRLQLAVLAEALWLVQEDIVDPADIDLAIRDGLGLRWATSGPFETLHLNGSGSFADYLSKAIPVLWPLMEELRQPFALEDDTIKRIADFRDSKVSPAEIVEAKARRGRLLQRLQPILNPNRI